MSDTHSNFNGRRFRSGRFIFFPMLFIGIAFLMGYAVMWLWNAILPQVTGAGMLSYWQAVGLLILCRILFGGFRGRGGGWAQRKKGFTGPGPHLRQRWMQMSDEERAKFQEEWRERCRKRDNN